MKGTSEGTVLLSRNTNTNGLLVHRADSNQFVTLYAHKANKLENLNVELVEPPGQTKIYVMIGMRDFNIEVTPSNNNDSILLKNHYVYASEEIWITTNNPYAYAVSGFVGFSS